MPASCPYCYSCTDMSSAQKKPEAPVVVQGVAVVAVARPDEVDEVEVDLAAVDHAEEDVGEADSVAAHQGVRLVAVAGSVVAGAEGEASGAHSQSVRLLLCFSALFSLVPLVCMHWRWAGQIIVKLKYMRYVCKATGYGIRFAPTRT